MLTVDYDLLGLEAGERLLDLGCGFGRHTYEALKRGAEVLSCDLAGPELRQVRDLVRVLMAEGQTDASAMAASVQADAVRLPFDDAAFDKVVASEVLEHVHDDATAFAELARVLRPGGRLAVTVPSWLSETVCWKLSSDYHAPAAAGGHVRIYRLSEMRLKLRQVGLEPGRWHRAHGLHTPYWWLRCAVGPDRDIDDNRLVRACHRLLEWDIVEQPLVTRAAERLLKPALGKSLVVYADRPQTASRPASDPLPAAETPAARTPEQAAAPAAGSTAEQAAMPVSFDAVAGAAHGA